MAMLRFHTQGQRVRPRLWLVGLWVCACTISLGGQTRPAVSPRTDLAARLQQLLELFEGEFDNYAQVWEEKEQKTPYPHEHIHSIFRRVPLPALGPHIFYVKQYLDGDPQKVYRQRLYSFVPNSQENALELRIYTFPDEQAVMDAHLNPAKLAGLTLDKLRATPGCEVYWRGQGAEFLGTMKPTCRVNSQRSGKTIVITDNLKLNQEAIWINDQATDTAGNYVFGNRSGQPHKLKRCRFFSGWAALRVAETGDEQKDYLGFFNLRLHDQGQVLPLLKVDGTPTPYQLQLAQLVQQSSRVPVLVLKVFETGKPQAVTYAWTEPASSRIGLNLRWLQAGFSWPP